MLALVGCGEQSSGDVEIVVTPEAVTDIVEDSVDGDTEPKVECVGRTLCEVTYTIPEKPDGPDADLEMFEDQRAVWAALFSDPQFQDGVVLLLAPATDGNSAEPTEEALRVRCELDAVKGFDWESVDAARVKDVCIWN